LVPYTHNMSSGASTLRNAVKRVTHKERAQPKARAKLGLLEKKKDYIVRAQDFHKKQEYLKNLRKKAADRNPDEFYFKMHKSKLSKGKHKDIKEGTSLDTDVVKLMKSQDMGYITHRKTLDDRKIDRLKSTLHMIGDKKPRSHKVFVDSSEDVEKFDTAEYFETAKELVDRSYNRIKVKDIEKAVQSEPGTLPLPSEKQLRKAMIKKEKSYKELQARINRSNKLAKAASELRLQRNLMGKGTKRKIVVEASGNDEEKVVYKWKRQRSR
jgi:U3 small nucleolar RNA-associated protein 11